MDDIVWFHDFLLWIIAAITLFVLGLLLIVIVEFNARANPVPSRTTHNTFIEVLWTVVPVLILVTIAVPSFRLLFYQLKVPPADVTVKATGKQWFWSYSYPDRKFEFDSLMVQDKDLKADQPRLLAVDNEMVVPVNKVVRRADHRRRRHPFVLGAGLRHQDRRHPGPRQRDLVQGRARRHLLRPVLAALRPRPRLHADRRACGERAGNTRPGSRRRRRNTPPTTAARRPSPTRPSDLAKRPG